MMSNSIAHPHDHFVKSMMEDREIAKSFFEEYLPVHIRDQVNLNSIRLQNGTFIDEDLKTQSVDLLYKAQFGERSGYLYLILEHQSTADYWMPFRLLKYMVSIMDSHIKQPKSRELPIIYPMVLYANKRPYRYSTDFWNLFGERKELAKSILFQPFELMDLTQCPEEKLKVLHNIRLQIILRTLKNVWNEDIFPFLKEVHDDLVQIEKKGGSDFSQILLKYIINTAQTKNKEELVEVLDGFSQETKGEVMNIAEQFRKEGREKGIQEGIQQGMQQGHQEAIQKMEAAIKLLRQGKEVLYISQMTHLPENEIILLKKTLEQ